MATIKDLNDLKKELEFEKAEMKQLIEEERKNYNETCDGFKKS